MSDLRPLTDVDLSAAQALTASFGWPHRLADYAGPAIRMVRGPLSPAGAVTAYALASQAFG